MLLVLLLAGQAALGCGVGVAADVNLGAQLFAALAQAAESSIDIGQ
ncbi:MAG: hypothetical protein QM696_06945 [Steroidobacteraceae bacterium]